jgi:hypothetical protein
MVPYQIWSEGYIATDQHGNALYHGSQEADNFEDALNKFAAANPEFNRYYNKRHKTFWGCCLFDNEKDARKRFG